MPIELTRQDEMAILRINRPERLNALNGEMITDIGRLLDQIDASDARALIITGVGEKAFCAGADITELMGRSIEQEYRATWHGQQTFARLDQFRLPSIALVNGYALGGGCELAMACTFRLATKQARFGLPEVKLGLVPGYGGTQRLPRLVGLARSLELMLSARFVGAEEAHRIGLVSQVVEEDALTAAITYARQFTSFSLLSMRLIRDAAQRGIQMPLAEGLRLEADLSTVSMESVDGKEGVQAFLEKRAPKFQDR